MKKTKDGGQHSLGPESIANETLGQRTRQKVSSRSHESKQRKEDDTGLFLSPGCRHYWERGGTTKALKWFRSRPWNQWWFEFSTARARSGSFLYPTSHAFIAAKTKSQYHRTLFVQCTGAKPTPVQIRKRSKKNRLKTRDFSLPYLGNWEALRQKAYFSDKESLEQLRVVIAEQMDALEAARGIASIYLDEIAKLVRYSDQLDEAFGHVIAPPLPDNDVSEHEMKVALDLLSCRTRLFLDVKERISQQLIAFGRQYLLCHGVGEDQVSEFGALVQAMKITISKQSCPRPDCPMRAKGSDIGREKDKR